MKFLSTLLVIFLSGLGLAAAENKPAILFAVPNENRYAYVGFDYLRAVAQAGFAVDYIEGASEFTWERVKKFNVVVVLDFPAANAAEGQFSQFPPGDAGRLHDYFGVLDRFRQAGGGVLVHYSPSGGGGAPNQLLKAWGLQFPLLALHDTRVERLSNLAYNNDCAFTDRVAPSPVSDGVRQIWYPVFGPHYCTWHTMPLLVDAHWQAVVRAARTAWTEIPKFDRGGFQPGPGALIPTEPITDPVLFAIRDDGDHGRLAAAQTWHQFSIGSGMKWLYNNEILERGLAGQPSQYGRLLRNTYRWLAEPSLKGKSLGGFVADPNRLLEPQLKPGAIDQFHEWFYQENEVLGYHRPPAAGKIFRGLIGAQTAASGGTGTVADYAKAAADAGLDYLVILEDFAQLTPAKFDQLKTATQAAATPALRIFPGYRLRSNTGNYLFIYGVNPPWPPAHLLVGAPKDVFNLQYQDERGQYAGAGAPLDWLLGLMGDAVKSTAGYYNFSRSGPSALQMHDLRAYSQAALRTYEGGKLIEDATDDYLTTWRCTLGPTPVSLNLVRSPAELRAAVAGGQALTYAQARSLASLWEDALRWNGSYDGMNVFLSSGPIIHCWPKNHRVMTFGAECFVPGRSLTVAPLEVSSTVGLKEIRIYDGERLFRRFRCQGAKTFKQQLLFPGVVRRSLVLVAEDTNGGRAVSYPLCQYKEGAKGPVFCGDHVNDCGYMLLAHGPIWKGLAYTPLVPDAGRTWDGGPVARKPLLTISGSWPVLETKFTPVEWSGQMPYQTPLLEFADEGVSRCRSVCDRKLLPAVEAVASNPWFGYGPLEPTRLADAWASHTLFDQYTTGVDPMSYGAPGISRGPLVSLFTQQIRFKTNAVIDRCRLFDGGWRPTDLPASVQFATGHGGVIFDHLDLSLAPETEQTYRIGTGDWFALYSRLTANACLVINRGPAIVLRFPPTGDLWFKAYAAPEGERVRPGETWDTELCTISWPLDEKFTSASSLARVVEYLAAPTGLRLARGRRGESAGGLLELVPKDFAVELSIPKSPLPVTVPVRVSGLNRRWSAGLYQLAGYRTHYYSKTDTGWRALGLDFDGRAYVPLYVSQAVTTHVLVGHPLVADRAGTNLFIQVTQLNDGTESTPPAWQVAVNNPTDRPITATLRQTMALPGLVVAARTITLPPGEYRVLTPMRHAKNN